MLPNYLDCSHSGPQTELLLVEGKSALSAVNQVRSRRLQAVLAMQGKVPNAARRPLHTLMTNGHCIELASRLGTGQGPDCQPDRLHFGKVCILSESDPDGEHAKWLLCLLFQNMFSGLVDQGRICIVAAPLYRVQFGRLDESSDQAIKNTRYLWSEEERRRYLNDADNENTGTLTQFKGLASLSSAELFTLVVDPATRQETLVTAGVETTDQSHTKDLP